MAIYLKEFSTHSEYNAYINGSGAILPNVSICTTEGDVHYNPYVAPPQPYSGFCKLYLNNGSEVEIHGSGTLALTDAQKEQYKNTCVAIEIGTQCTAIGDNAFYYYDEDYGLTAMTSVTIPNTVTSIGEYAFMYCTSLTSIDIPNSVTSIGYMAFYGCSGLTSCTIGSGVTSIGVSAFKDCSGLTSIDIQSGVTSIDDEAFEGCTSLTSITIPDSVTSIDSYAFSHCNSIASITIGSGVTSIGYETFSSCGGLTSITVNATTPPTLSHANAFVDTNNCPIYVPSGSVDAYKAARYWSDLSSRIQAIP